MVRKSKKQAEKVDEGRGVPETLTTFPKQRDMPKCEKVRVHRPQVREYLGSVARLLDWLQSADISAEEQSWLVEYCRKVLRVVHEKNLKSSTEE
jgi:hypothetical protein